MKTSKIQSSRPTGGKEKPMSYKQHHLKNYLQSRPAISIASIEKACKLSKDTLRHFMSGRRSIPTKHFKVVEKELINYGYSSLENE